MTIKLFDEIQRDYTGPASDVESTYEYLNRSARVEIDNIRRLVEDWFHHYPLSEANELYSRFRSKDERQHKSAFFEILLHELLLKLNCQVEIHPEINTTFAKHPDFLVKSKENEDFYLEAVVVAVESEKKEAARLRMNVVRDVLNQMSSPNFFIGINLRGYPDTSPPVRNIRSFLQKHLEGLDPDKLSQIQELGGLKALPHWLYEHKGWEIEFYPIPKSTKIREEIGVRSIGMEFHDFQLIDSITPVKKALLGKAGRYGNLNLPYVIAVNTVGLHVDDIDIMNVLFGTEQYVFNSGSKKEKLNRKLDGLWTSNCGPRYTRVSAVLVASVSPSNLANANICLYHNPWAEKKYNSILISLPQAVPVLKDNIIKRKEGESLTRIFNLSSEWPRFEER
jgi:hypothetical protein